MNTYSPKKLTLPLVGILVLLFAIVTGYMLIDRFMNKPVEIKDIQIDTKAALKLNILKQISKKNGITEWELTADSATLLNNEKKAVLIDVSVIFYTQDKKKVLLTSKEGVLNTKTHDMTFTGNVIVTYEGAVLRTDQLQYNKKEHIIFSNVRVRLDKQDSNIEADSMTSYLNTGTVILKGHVKGQFSENFKIE